jgi:hypothetical protein
MDKPADYRITVQGVVPESWQDRLGGLRIATVANGKTTLEGQMPDQAALNGVLDTLYGLNLPLLEVIWLSHEGAIYREQAKITEKGDEKV